MALSLFNKDAYELETKEPIFFKQSVQRCLRRSLPSFWVCAAGNRIAVATIHQPSWAVLQSFSTVTLLAAGGLAFSGTVDRSTHSRIQEGPLDTSLLKSVMGASSAINVFLLLSFGERQNAGCSISPANSAHGKDIA
eukprot:6489377-Amphidinium_carterae.1